MPASAVLHVGPYSATLRDAEGGRLATLLWGDPLHVLDDGTDPVKVRARGRVGYVERSVLAGRSLLEIYVIDVGQGDSVLFKTPEGRWHLIDAGSAARDQMTRKGAANFLRWKFYRDLREREIRLENVIVTHPDLDHYGGLLDLLSGRLYSGTPFRIAVENFYHNGLARFDAAPRLGMRQRGEVAPFPQGYHRIRQRGTFITELLDDRQSFANPPRELAEGFAEVAALISQVPRQVALLSQRDRFLPGYAPGDSTVSIHVLGPVLEEFAPGQLGLRVLESDSKTRNGHSVVLRLDYGAARILLTGDLNGKSQRLLLSYHPAADFAVDVAKGCHHGSEDIELDFLRAEQAGATVISSGDNEDYSHPRPVVIGASGHYGRELVDRDGHLLPPLIYSTELARSVRLARAAAARVELEEVGVAEERQVPPEDIDIKPDAGPRWYRRLDRTPLATDLVYGLVNIRTDGETILCATMEEKGNDFDIKVFRTGSSPP